MLHRSSSVRAVAVATTIALGACSGPAAPPESAATDDVAEEADVDARAVRLAHDLLIVDGHVDLPYRLGGELEDITVETDGHFDLPKARAGGLDAPFMSIYVPAELQETGKAKEHADKLIDLVESIAAEWPDDFAVATSTDDVVAAKAAGKIALPMGMENGAPIETLEDVAYFAERGIRYVTLTHSENNQLCDSSYATERTWNGLSPFGAEVVAEMNRLGVMVDISHVSDDTASQVLELTDVPVIASHSSARHFTPGFERNMSDELIAKVGENGGVVQINFGSAFLTEAANVQSLESWAVVQAFLDEHELSWDDEAAEEKMAEFWAENEPVATHVTDVADHIDHVVEIAGIDHVGLGSDYDGVTALPVELGDASTFPVLIAELIRRGYSDEEIEKVLSGNVMRVWRAVEAAAESDVTATDT